MLTRLYCWWFGHDPDYSTQYYDQDFGWSEPSCKRCGSEYVDYADCVGFTRHQRFMDFLGTCRYWLLFGWVPRRCKDCGEYPSKCDCPPF